MSDATREHLIRERILAQGVAEAPAARMRQVSGNGRILASGGMVKVSTQRPDIHYRIFENRRTKAIERLPEGIDPGFGWNAGLVGRDVPLLDAALRKTRQDWPTQFEQVTKALFTHAARQDAYKAFIKNALDREVHTSGKLAPVGFIDDKTLGFLKAQGIEPDTHLIVLEDTLPKAAKYDRHAAKNEKPLTSDWENLLAYLLHGSVYIDKGDLIFLASNIEDEIKIVVNLKPEKGLKSRGASYTGPKIVTVYTPQESEISRIKNTLKKIR